MPLNSATAQAHPNIAFIKYWGNRDQALRIPANGSISLTLAGLQNQTTVRFDAELPADRVTVNGRSQDAARVSRVLDLVRRRAGISEHAEVDSQSDVPPGAGIASSAAAFAALSLAASQAAGLELNPKELSALARRGSGSAARSVLGGYVELPTAADDSSCYAQAIAGPQHWELVDVIAIVSRSPKPVASTDGHALADTSPLQPARVEDAPRRLADCRAAILSRDFDRLASVAEQDSDLMHAVMRTSRPGIYYWLPASVAAMRQVRSLRTEGMAVFYTVDAGPNVHCICLPEAEAAVRERLEQLPGLLEILRGTPGSGAQLLQK